jgi:CheY-like chemotaxis protein
VDLGSLVVDLDKLVRRLVGSRIEVVTEVADELWSHRADPGQMEQIVINLAVNARDAMPDGGRLVVAVRNVTIDAMPGQPAQKVPVGDYVELTVSDTGTGMTPDVMEHAFDPFFTTKEQGRGTGLGLATVYGIVQRHEAHIITDTSPGTGTTFRILFPRATPTPAPGAPTVAADPRAEGQTVLVVEDDHLVRTMTCRTLRQLGYRVIEAALPSDAIAMASDPARSIDLLLSDVMMPLMSGTEVAARVRAIHPTIPVLLMSGYTEQSVGDLAGQKHGYRFLSKPFTRAQLAGQVSAALERADDAAERQSGSHRPRL